MCIRFCPTKERRSFPRSICSATVCKWCAGWILVRMLPTASHMDRAWLAGWIGSTRYSRYMYAELDWWLRSRNWQAFLLNDCLPEWFGKSTLDWLNDGPLITIIIIYLGILHHQFISFITGHILQYVTWRLEIELTSISNIYFIIVVVQVDVCFVCLLTRIMIDRLLFIPTTPIPLMSHKSRTFF